MRVSIKPKRAQKDNLGTLHTNEPWETWFIQRGRDEPFTGGCVRCCWAPIRDDGGQSEICMPRCIALKNRHLPDRKGWDLYRRVIEHCWVPKRDDAGWSEICMPRYNTLKNQDLPERKSWALYRRVSELLVVLYMRLSRQYFFYKYYKRLKCKIKTPRSMKNKFIHIWYA